LTTLMGIGIGAVVARRKRRDKTKAAPVPGRSA
jgi:hypothetical protein